MDSPNKDDELARLLESEAFKKECFALIYSYVRDMSEAKEVFREGRADLLKQGASGIREMKPFIRAVMTHKAIAQLKKKLNKKEIYTDKQIEKSTTDPLFTHIEFSEIRKAVKQHRDDLDFTIFEMISQGYKYKEIAAFTRIKQGTIGKRLSVLYLWIKLFFNER